MMGLRKVAALAAVVVALAGCGAHMASDGPGRVSDPATGTYGQHSGRYEVGDNLTARATYVLGAGFALFTDYRTGTWAFLDRAYSEGRRLDYTVADRNVIGCRNGCKMVESGIVRLLTKDVTQYAKTGMPLTLLGSRGRVEGFIPAKAFQEVLTQ